MRAVAYLFLAGLLATAAARQTPVARGALAAASAQGEWEKPWFCHDLDW